MRIAKHDVHAAASVFPLMEGAEYAALVTDIQRHGLRDPITRLDGKILDGRNRLRACVDAGVRPRFDEYDGDDPLAFVVSCNLHRRHLNASQRALVAAKIANLPARRPSKEELRKSADFPAAIAAELLNVGTRTVELAKAVIDHALPEVVQAIERGHLTVNAATQLAKLPPDVQRGVVERAWGDDDDEPLDADEIREVVKKHTAQNPDDPIKLTIIIARALKDSLDRAAAGVGVSACELVVECVKERYAQ